MRLDNERPSDNIEDRRGQGGGGGFGFPRGGGMRVPMGGGRGISMSTIIMLVIAYFAIKFIFGIDLLDILSGGGGGLQPVPQQQQQQGESQIAGAGRPDRWPATPMSPAMPAAISLRASWARPSGCGRKNFRRWASNIPHPNSSSSRASCNRPAASAQSAMGPFYCPSDNKVYIDLSFYQDMKNKLGAPGDFAQAYVVAHEVGHHLQNVFGIADKVMQRRMQAPEAEANQLSVMMELQADCFAGVWARKANDSRNIIEEGDVEEGLNAASAIGDDRLQKRSQGYVVPESFTHGSSEQRVRWFKRGMETGDLAICDTFSAQQL